MNKTINIDVPEGFEIDTENSNLEQGKIVFKKKEETSWRHTKHVVTGYYIERDSRIAEVTRMTSCNNQSKVDRNIFATRKQAESMLAMAQLSQIMANDKRFGKPITNDDWTNRNVTKYIIERTGNAITTDVWWGKHYFLAFRTAQQRDLFLEENRDLIKQYFMID